MILTSRMGFAKNFEMASCLASPVVWEQVLPAPGKEGDDDHDDGGGESAAVFLQGSRTC